MKNYLGTSVKDGANFVDQIQKRGGDINLNGVYDVYDYAFTMFKLDGGTKQTGTAAGSVRLAPEKEEVKAGETFRIFVLAEQTENINAFGKVIDYDPENLEFISTEKAEGIASMEDLTVNKIYSDGTAYVNLAFSKPWRQTIIPRRRTACCYHHESTDRLTSAEGDGAWRCIDPGAQIRFK